ncbi:Neuronal acetylcholine receptor subunit non-alpha-2 [Holothuria leucospilota]|uniref:Neuronal acetylcholine receptor subunit non-alpha-2 n=1 Tax=Holothuria leucospilota TaxID=206669 RepID=A0A9Q1BSR4_HOLLE|nr:Neuronal acetylcholine receptor subunit non-alpha-2 [Holothuria leucospilota]
MVLGLTVFQLLVADILPSARKQNPILSFYLIVALCLAGLTVPLSLLNIQIAYGDSKIFILKYSCLRTAFLEYLPKICSVPTYSERIKQLVTIKPRGSNEITRPEGTIAATEEDEATELAKELLKMEEFITNTDKTKIEARTVALVFDRICLVGFVICFTVSFVETILDFFGNPDVSYDFCEQPNFI